MPFPINFAVHGTPVGPKSTKARKPWVEAVQAAAHHVLPEDWKPTKCELSLTIYDFPQEEPQGDVDNIIKRIQDAMNGIVYEDDKQVKRVTAQRFLPKDYQNLEPLPNLVAEALVNDPPFVYLSISDKPMEEAQ